MTDYNWCHGPECHKRQTTNRIRGVKGNKVLRTKKIRPEWLDQRHLLGILSVTRLVCTILLINTIWSSSGYTQGPSALETPVDP